MTKAELVDMNKGTKGNLENVCLMLCNASRLVMEAAAHRLHSLLISTGPGLQQPAAGGSHLPHADMTT